MNDKRAEKRAAALRYPEGFPAPFLVCKGTGRLADRMTELAAELGIPLVFEPETAHILSLQEVGTYIPPETYGVIAAVFAFLKENEVHGKN